MKHSYLNRATLSLVLIILLLFSACTRDFSLAPKLSISGQITDDITGAPVYIGGTVRVDGFNSAGAGLNPTWKQNLGSGSIYPGGVFNYSFTRWSKATHYYIYFEYDNNSYINNGSVYLNTIALDAFLFNSGHHALEIRAAKMTTLRVNFRNINPFNSDDRLQIILPSPTDDILFGYKFPRWENLQFCTYDSVSGEITGGINARGSQVCNVPSDRKFVVKWKTKKNGIEQMFQDSILCPRDIPTAYTLGY